MEEKQDPSLGPDAEVAVVCSIALLTMVVNPFTVKQCHRERQKRVFQYHSKEAEENNVLYRHLKYLYRSWNCKKRKPW